MTERTNARPSPAETLNDWLEEWRRVGAWNPTKADTQRLVDEIERLREQNTGLGVRVQQGWAKIEELTLAPDNLAPECGETCGPCTRGDHEACIAASTDVCRCFDQEHEDDGG